MTSTCMRWRVNRCWDTLTAIRHRTTVSALGTQRYANSERHLRAIAELQEIYPEDLLQESVKIAQSLHVFAG